MVRALLLTLALLLSSNALVSGWFQVRLTNQRTSVQVHQYLVQHQGLFVWSVGANAQIHNRTYVVTGAVQTVAQLFWGDQFYALEGGYSLEYGLEFGVRLGVTW